MRLKQRRDLWHQLRREHAAGQRHDFHHLHIPVVRTREGNGAVPAGSVGDEENHLSLIIYPCTNSSSTPPVLEG